MDGRGTVFITGPPGSPPCPPYPAGDLAQQRETLMRTRGTLGERYISLTNYTYNSMHMFINYVYLLLPRQRETFMWTHTG